LEEEREMFETIAERSARVNTRLVIEGETASVQL
jgi:hypothetical protein